MHPTKDSLIDIVGDARKGRVVLPEFQRSFIWNRRQIEELVVSVLNEYFIGSLLTLNVVPDNVPFRPRIIEGVEDSVPHPATMILDGQQRVTSIHYALYGPDINLKGTSFPYRFFLNIEAAINERWDEAVFSLPAYQKSVPALFDQPDRQYRESCMALSALRSWEAWMDWHSGYRDYLTKTDRLDKQRLDQLTASAKRFLNFQVAVISLPQSTPLPMVVEVFERINRTGERLGVFELLTARLWGDGIALRDLWDNAIEEHARLAAVSDLKSERYPTFALQVLALLRGKECKRKDLILLDGASFEEDWHRATGAIEAALERLQSTASGGYGMVPRVSAPYSTMVTPLALMLHHVDNLPASVAAAYDKIDHWYWSSVFRGRYGGSTESKSYRDVSQVKAWIGDDRVVPEAVPTHQDEVKRELTNVRSGAAYRGILCLVALRGAQDFFTGQSIELHDLDHHHIFPKAFLRTSQVAADQQNTVLNRTLISADTNRRVIRAKRPSRYLAEMEADLGRERVREVLASHFIDDSAIKAMREDNYDRFLSARERALRAEIVRRCVHSTIGAVVEADEGFVAGQENARLDRLETALRDLIDEFLHEMAGDRYWRQLIPPDIRAGVHKRLQLEQMLHPRGDGAPQVTHRDRLDFCDFSDYAQIILQRNVWPSLEPVFTRRGEFERHATSLRRYRNGLKHGREIETVDHLSGGAAIIWFERAIGETRFTDRVVAEEEATVEDCLRVLTRRTVPRGQRELYQALVRAGPRGLTATELVGQMARESSTLGGIMGALGKRVNKTPGFGAANKPGAEMLLDTAEDSEGQSRYSLTPVMAEALRKFAPAWISESDLSVFDAAPAELIGRGEASGQTERTQHKQQITENQQVYLQFWREFKAFLENNSTTLRSREPKPHYCTGFAIGRTHFEVLAVAAFWNAHDHTYESNELRVELIVGSKDAYRHFEVLRRRKREIEKAFGFPAAWDQTPEKQRCRILVRRTIDLSDRNAWSDFHAWLLRHLEAFDRVLRPMIAEL
ncbi:MAG: DUF4268 domain-containing protein [Gammaproteobacteria bacterium]|nr:DUF4268 domain-containing protein [Gammaproteobacteria bacterium]MDE0258737.1 DUF4268 domain-containing protein [Gammaproteobacteria bacterium]